jgi:bla regulator protein blaR1
MRLHVTALMAIFASPLATQPLARQSFDVASIKRNPDCRNGQRRPSPGRLDFLCVSVRELLMISYGALQGEPVQVVPISVLGGPGWIDTDRYDLSAKARGRPPVQDMLGPMLIGLLEERLHLKAHLEPRDTPVYALRLADGPHRLQPVVDGSCKFVDLENMPGAGDQTRYCGFGRSRNEAGTVIADWYGNTMAELASRGLPIYVGRRVVDQTGVSGRFDLHVEFRRASADEPESTAPTIFTALQRLGLSLIPTKAPIDVVVIDGIERPSEN